MSRRKRYCLDCGKGITGHSSPERCQSCAARGNKNSLGYKWTKKQLKEKIGNKNCLGKHWKCSKETVKKRVASLKEYYLNHPESCETGERNCLGINCYSDDGVFHPSLAQRECYDWIRKELKLKIRKFGRFDFIIEGRIILEYHPCNWFLEKRSKKQYSEDRRKLLDDMGHKDLKLVVMTSLSDREKAKGLRRIKGGSR